MARQPYPLAKVYGLLEPGPVVLLSTAGPERPNVMTLSWHTMLDFEPPLLACVVSDDDYSYGLLLENGECVINIPTVEIAEQVVGCGNSSGAEVDKFTRFGLTAAPAEQVGAPLIDECYANLECRLADTDMVDSYGLFVLEVVQAWADTAVQAPRTLHHEGMGRFRVAGERIQLPSKMK
jgi:flavin reductase (DIM6/NTAB) family NADH-FMN oxidoreductase RutF